MQVFSRRAVLLIKLALLALPVSAAVSIAIYRWSQAMPYGIGAAVPQPIPFSHKHHAGDDGIDCRYCHAGVETSRTAGLPSTETCLTCHSQLFGDAALLAPLRASPASGRAMPWRRVHDLPDFVYFDHGIHVRNGVGCAACHGPVDQMPLTWRHAALDMQWCLACHRAPDSARRVGARRLTDCSSCHR